MYDSNKMDIKNSSWDDYYIPRKPEPGPLLKTPKFCKNETSCILVINSIIIVLIVLYFFFSHITAKRNLQSMSIGGQISLGVDKLSVKDLRTNSARLLEVISGFKVSNTGVYTKKWKQPKHTYISDIEFLCKSSARLAAIGNIGFNVGTSEGNGDITSSVDGLLFNGTQLNKGFLVLDSNIQNSGYTTKERNIYVQITNTQTPIKSGDFSVMIYFNQIKN